MIQVDYKLMNSIANAIIDKLRALLNVSEVQLSKMFQNVRMNALIMLGKFIDETKIDTFIQRIVNGYINSLPRRGENVGILSAQSLVQPITQGILKAQHSSGKKDGGTETNLIKLNSMKVSPRIITLHMNNPSKERLEQWANLNEHCTFGEVLSSTHGNCKYVPNPRGVKHQGELADLIAERKFYVHIDKLCETFYTFHIDKFKLEEMNITHREIFRTLASFPCFGFVMHPLKTFTFELCPAVVESSSPNDKVISHFNNMIGELMKTTIKGIKGIDAIDVKCIKATDVIIFSCYVESEETTKLYVVPEMLIYFPIDELEKRLGMSVVQSCDLTEPDHLIVNGKFDINTLASMEPYYYLSIRGTSNDFTLDNLMNMENFDELFRTDYILSNDPYEIEKHLGIISAQTIYEMNYSMSLKANKFSLAYPHIQILCSKLFSGTGMKPITPYGFEGTEGVNPLDKLAYQNYSRHLSTEPLRAASNGCIPKYPVKGLITSTLLGAKYRYGSNYAKFEINETARQLVLDACSEARTKQYYNSDRAYVGIDFYGIGHIKHVKSGISRALDTAMVMDVDF